MRLMYDAVYPVNIPKNAEMVAGYVNGDYAWKSSDWNLFPDAVKLRIDVTGGQPLASDILDVEPGNLGTPEITPQMTPAQAEAVWAELCDKALQWVSYRHSHDIGSTCYIQASRKNQLADILAGKPVVFHMASWGITQDQAQALVKNAEVAVQFRNTPGYDVSVVSDLWYPASAPAKPAAAPVTLKSAELTLTYSDESVKTEKWQ